MNKSSSIAARVTRVSVRVTSSNVSSARSTCVRAAGGSATSVTNVIRFTALRAVMACSTLKNAAHSRATVTVAAIIISRIVAANDRNPIVEFQIRSAVSDGKTN